MDIRVLEQIEPAVFNTQAVHPLQSWEWGEARKQMGIRVVRLAEFTNEILGNVYQMTLHKIPYTHFQIGYIPRSVVPSIELLTFLQDFGKQHNIIFIKFEPNSVEKSQIPSTLVQSAHPLFPNWTMVLDLTQSEEVLFSQLKSKTRYNIRLAEKKGVTVKESSNDVGYQDFEKLYFETTKRQHYYGHTKSYHRIIWETLKNKLAHILIAYYENKPLAAYELFLFNNTLYYPYGGTSLEYRNLMGANLLMWEAIKLGKHLGASKFDMWGAMGPGYDENHPWAGFTRFKEGYNAKFTEMVGSYDLILKPAAYKLYTTAHKLRNWWLEVM